MKIFLKVFKGNENSKSKFKIIFLKVFAEMIKTGQCQNLGLECQNFFLDFDGGNQKNGSKNF